MDETLYETLHRIEANHWWFRGRREVIRALLSRAPVEPPCDFLDAGCGTGFNLREFAWLGNGAGAEPSAQAIEFAAARGIGGIVESSADALPFPDDSFDLVMALDVIEHIDDDVGAMRELRRVARPNGALLVTVPAYRWLWSTHDDTHHHKRRYTARMLRRNVEAAGWRVRYSTYFNSLLLPPIALVRLLARSGRERNDYELTDGPLNDLLVHPMKLEARAIAAGIRLPAGVSVGAVLVPA